tara:strand:+ start:3435 stop:3782 length:348 start_codon:yes stop_codon:yes gene_type:complete
MDMMVGSVTGVTRARLALRTISNPVADAAGAGATDAADAADATDAADAAGAAGAAGAADAVSCISVYNLSKSIALLFALLCCVVAILLKTSFLSAWDMLDTSRLSVRETAGVDAG